jgi:coproporphyrinogen III oxidase
MHGIGYIGLPYNMIKFKTWKHYGKKKRKKKKRGVGHTRYTWHPKSNHSPSFFVIFDVGNSVLSETYMKMALQENEGTMDDREKMYLMASEMVRKFLLFFF